MYLEGLHSTIIAPLASAYGDVAAFVCVLSLHNIAVFTVVNTFFFLVDVLDLFPEKRIRNKTQKPSRELVMKALASVGFHNIVGFPIASYLYYSLVQRYTPDVKLMSPPEDYLTLVFKLLCCIALEDTMFYWLHRMLHHKSIYKHIHKQHHEFRNSIGIASEYAHPIEVVLSNALPFFLGPYLTGMSLTALCLWDLVRIWETIDAHSGYAFDWSPWHFLSSVQGGPERHDFHHSHNVGSYGSFTTFWDWVMGTDARFHEFQAKKKAMQASNKSE